jgi:ATP phosphoribosyltransferase regulatory subunit
VLSRTAALPALAELEALWRAASDDGIGSRLSLDLGETRRFAYYSGAMFQILAEGPGRPVGAGGRYDGLLERFGLPRAAAGFAVDLDNLDWALRVAGVAEVASPKVLVAPAESAAALLELLRREGVPCAPAPEGAFQEYAKAWRFTHVLVLSGERAELRSMTDGASVELDAPGLGSLASAIASRVLSEKEAR